MNSKSAVKSLGLGYASSSLLFIAECEFATKTPHMPDQGDVLQDTAFVLEMQNISKSYYKNQVLDDISLSLKPGEIHALLGENGAGKSTLMNILFGMPVIHSTGGFQGTVKINGQPVTFKSPMEAMNMGIGMVHQEFMLIPDFTVAENIKLNREVTRPNPVSRVLGKELETLDTARMLKDVRAALDRLDVGIDELAKISSMPVGYKQFVEIAREIDKENIQLLVFDEPTAVLTEGEADTLLKAMKRLSDAGVAILFITHRLDEVMAVADNITVLRDGKLAGSKKTSETDVYELAELMVGRKVEKTFDKSIRDCCSRPVALRTRKLRVLMPGEMVHGVDLDIHEGEIFGIGGLAGQGKIGIANGVMGMYPATGQVEVFGEPLTLNDAQAALKMDIAFVSEDRKGVGLLLDMSIEMNIAVPSIQNKEKFLAKIPGLFSQIRFKEVRRNALDMIDQLDIRCTGPKQMVRRLSGGNQQKVCLAKAWTYGPRILFVSEPTRGIDIGAKKLVLDTLVKMNKEDGITIIMTSSELAELKTICDRIAIIDDGRVAGILKGDDDNVKFGLLMGGKRIDTN